MEISNEYLSRVKFIDCDFVEILLEIIFSIWAYTFLECEVHKVNLITGLSGLVFVFITINSEQQFSTSDYAFGFGC